MKSIVKSTTDVSLNIIQLITEDYLVLVLPQHMEVAISNKLKRFCIRYLHCYYGIGTYNVVRIVDTESSVLKSKPDILVDITQVHEEHLHHQTRFEQTNTLLADLLETNMW